MTLDVRSGRLTPMPLANVAALLASTWPHWDDLGPPPATLVGALVAIVGEETLGGRFIHEHNLANISASGGAVWANPKPQASAPVYFAAYDSPEAGARAFWGLLFRRYPSVILAGLEGEPETAARELYRTGFVVALRPGESSDYARGMRRYYREIWPEVQTLGGGARTLASVFAVSTFGAALALGGAMLQRSAA